MVVVGPIDVAQLARDLKAADHLAHPDVVDEDGPLAVHERGIGEVLAVR